MFDLMGKDAMVFRHTRPAANQPTPSSSSRPRAGSTPSGTTSATSSPHDPGRQHPGDLGAIVARTRYLLLDFDGPVCSIFAGLPAPEVADELRKLFTPKQLTDTAKNTPTRSRCSSTRPRSARNWPLASKPR